MVLSLTFLIFQKGVDPQLPQRMQNQTRETFHCAKLDRKGKKIAYQIGTRTRTNDGVLLLNISTNKTNFQHDTLIALACQLSANSTTESRIFVQIFDSQRSARRYVPQWQDEKPPDWQKNLASLRASYLRDSAKHEHWIAWYTDATHKQEVFVALEDTVDRVSGPPRK